MLKVQRVWRLGAHFWRRILQHRSIAWAAGISVVVLIASCPFGVSSLSTSVNHSPLSFQTHGGAIILTPTPTPSPTQPGTSGPCSPVAGQEDSAMEAWQLEAVNQARASAGVAALSMDARIQSEALQHSRDMTCYGFGHYVPPGTTPASRMAAVGVSFTWHGENIGEAGEGTDLQKVMWLFNTMMAEQPPNDGHRQNILSPHFTMTGIGIYVENSSGDLWMTEDFAD